MDQQRSNPTILSPASRFAIPHYRSHSRSPSLSPSRSPHRRQHFTSRELDPLLSNLSPTSTLEALTATQAISLSGEKTQTALTTSIADASESERTLGIRAALAGKKLREWYQEVRGWGWLTGARSKINGFEMPSAEQTSRNKRKYDHDGNINQALLGYTGSAVSTDEEDEEYWGSLPALVVQHYEQRIEEIRDDMETLDVDELKEHVREAHSSSRSRPTSSDGSPWSHPSLSHYNHLDDFTAVITTTILQAIPYISRLDALLDVWSVRLLVLRQVPGFLDRLEGAQIALESAWHAIGSDSGSTPVKTKSDISREAFSTMKSILEDKVLELGHSIDTMLDALEGRGDSVPDQWIDRMEGIEAGFGSWVVEAEKQVMENELRYRKEKEESWQEYLNQNRQRLGHQNPLTLASNPTELQDQDGNSLAGSSWFAEPASPDKAKNDTGLTFSVRTLVNSSTSSNPRIPTQGASEVSRSWDSQHLPLRSLVLPPRLVEQSPRRSPVYEETDMREFLYAHVNALGQAADSDDDPEYGPKTRFGPYNAKLQRKLEMPEDIDTNSTAAVGAPSRINLQRPFGQQALDLQSHHSRNQSEVSTDTSNPGSATSECFSNMSSPEIQDAVMVEYFSKPTEISTSSPLHSPPNSFSRASSRTERSSISTIRNLGVSGTTDQTSPYSRSRTSSVAPEPTISKYISSSLEAAFGHGIGEVSPPGNGTLHDLPSRELADVLGVGQLSESSTFKDSQEQSPSVRAFNKRQSVAAANSALLTIIAKPKNHFDGFSSLGPDYSSIASQQPKATTACMNEDISTGESKDAPSPSRSTDDQLEARISSILTDIPMRIELASEPKIDTPDGVPPRTSSAAKGLGIISPTTRVNKVQTASPAVTLAPAFPRSARSRQSLRGDPEIKLYHLHQPGKEAPVKLFVRLVGDARERVMVRVGGGWADLGEYLKEYAIHHGRRSISDGRFEIQGLPSPRTTSPVTTTTPGNGRTTPANGRITPANSRTTPGSDPASPLFPTPPSLPLTKPPTLPLTIPPNPRHSTLTLPPPLTPPIPTRLSSKPHPHPYSNPKHAPSRSVESIGYPSVGLHSRYPFPSPIPLNNSSGDTPPLGLAGPKSRNKDISPGKQAWVDGMMERARASGGERGEMGRVGGTRRVVLRGREGGGG